MRIVCAHCGRHRDKPTGAVNRARAAGLPLFCDRRCAGLSRRKHKTKAQRVEEKRLYDAEYRNRNRGMIKARKHAYFQRTYNPAAAAKARKKRMPYHVEYCRRPEYRQKKQQYDAKRRASEYGPFSEAYQVLLQLNREINERISDYETRQANDTGNKTQRRRREAQTLNSY